MDISEDDHGEIDLLMQLYTLLNYVPLLCKPYIFSRLKVSIKNHNDLMKTMKYSAYYETRLVTNRTAVTTIYYTLERMHLYRGISHFICSGATTVRKHGRTETEGGPQSTT